MTTLGTLTGDTSISDPRSLKIDKKGKIRINTGSGHLVSLDPSTNKMTKHALPDGANNDLFGIAPDDDVIGYTATQTDKVGDAVPAFHAGHRLADHRGNRLGRLPGHRRERAGDAHQR